MQVWIYEDVIDGQDIKATIQTGAETNGDAFVTVADAELDGGQLFGLIKAKAVSILGADLAEYHLKNTRIGSSSFDIPLPWLIALIPD